MTAAMHPTIENPRPSWKPDGDAHLIFQWVKMEGKTQGWVAQAFGISQSTVSRIIQRYERWQAHAKDREDGRLDPTERLRAQRWLTFERNELIVASCLRIANEIEGFVDTSKSTIHRPLNNYTKETEIRTVHSTLDRTGTVNRFLRLAFRVNMEQLKLAAMLQSPPAAPLSEEELEEEARQLAADEEELKAARLRRGCADNDQEPRDEGACGSRSEPQPDKAATSVSAGVELRSPPATPAAQPDSSVVHTSHNLHTEIPPEIAATAGEPCRCASQCGCQENGGQTCIGRHDLLDAGTPRSSHVLSDLAVPAAQPPLE